MDNVAGPVRQFRPTQSMPGRSRGAQPFVGAAMADAQSQATT
jgi:hypothetical protein